MPGLILYIIFINIQTETEWSIYTRMDKQLLSSKIITVLSTLFNRYGMSTYLTVVKNPDIIYIYIRLRIDINVSSTSTSRSCKNIKDMCPFCGTEPERVLNFILRCHQFSFLRDKFYDNVSSHSSDLKDKNEMTQLKYILGPQMLEDIVVNIFEISTASEENMISNVVNAQMLIKTNILILMCKRKLVCISLQDELC